MGASSHLYISRTVDTATLKGAGRYTPDRDVLAGLSWGKTVVANCYLIHRRICSNFICGPNFSVFK
jgi:hypothetical protein